MKISITALFVIGTVLHSVKAAKKVLTQEEKAEQRLMYNENISGYLRNEGVNGYLNIADIDSKKKIVFSDTSGTKINIFPIRERYKNFALILPVSLMNTSTCSIRNNPTNQGEENLLVGCPVLQVNTPTPDLSVADYSKQKSSRFIFSPVKLGRSHAFRIYDGQRCLTVEDDMHAQMEPCIYNNLEKEKKQLFTWVKENIFNSNLKSENIIDLTDNPVVEGEAENNPLAIGRFYRE